jgi:hypothetical protein
MEPQHIKTKNNVNIKIIDVRINNINKMNDK